MFFSLVKNWITCVLLFSKTGFSSAIIFTPIVFLLWKAIFIKKSYRMNDFGKFSVNISVVDSWNKIQVQVGEKTLKDLRPSKSQWLSLTNSLKVTDLIFLNFVHSLWIHEWILYCSKLFFPQLLTLTPKLSHFTSKILACCNIYICC